MKDLFGNSLSAIGAGGDKLDWEFYPTPREVTISLLEFFRWPKMKVWEPACGELAISKVLEEYGHDVISTDLKYGNDFFKTERTGIKAIITNPPFKHSEKFIRKSLIDAPIVAMLLKSQYWHANKRANLFKSHPPVWVLALTWRPNFFGESATGSPTMDFIWTVWHRNWTGNTSYGLLKKPTKLNSEPNVQVSDTTESDSSTDDGKQIIKPNT
jgi:hypothetical protein